MIGLVMAGGKGSRMDGTTEKLLLKHKKSLVLHVIDALNDSQCFSKVIAVTSPNSPKTKELLQNSDIQVVDTTGVGYVEDLNQVLSSIDDYVFVTSGDLPFLDGDVIKKIVANYNPQYLWTSILVTKKFLKSLHISTKYTTIVDGQHCIYTGISMINAKQIKTLNPIKETYQIFDDKRIAFNLNTKQDLELLGTS